ncbi:MAG: TonB-dependent receptor [Acidobacteriota bacterium]
MHVLRRLLIGLTSLVILPAGAYAQASIAGVVKDSSGAILPGVTVEAASPVLIEKVRSAVSDGAGLYRIVDLRPGTYSMTFTLPGFTSVKRDGVELTGSFTATINAELKVGAVAETITVTGETPVVDLQSAKRETVLRGDVIESLPGTHAYGSLLNAIPGVTVDGNGAANSPTMTFFTARGGSTNEGRMTINGMVVAASFNGGGVSSLAYDANNVEEVSVVVAGGMGDTDVGGPVMNLVPRTGGNTFKGQVFWNTAGTWSRGDNLDDQLRNLQTPITLGPGIIGSYDFNPSYGGPIKRDKLWFWGSYRKFNTAQGVEGIFANKYALDPAHWDYLKDSSISARNVQGRDIYQGRITAQVTPKNRVMFSHEYQLRCEGSTLTTSGDGCRQRGADWIALGSTTQSPEANTGYFKLPYYVTQATWTAPVTSRILFEAGFSRFAYWTNNGPGQTPPDGTMALIPVTEQSAIDGHPANFIYRAVNSYFYNWANPDNWRASLSYVSGSNSIRVGYQGSFSISDTQTMTNDSLLAYRFQNRIPNQFTYRLPMWQVGDRTETASMYVEDSWTRGRLTLQGALRYDRAWSFSPAEGNGTTVASRFNAAAITFPRTDGVNAYNDLTPRFGAAYDVFGTGKTAIKFNLGHYLAPATNDSRYTLNNPAATAKIVTSVARTWADSNGNFAVDCDILNPAAQSGAGRDTCGEVTGNSLNFGKTGNNVAQVNEAMLHGWGVRPNDWQMGLNVQHELMPRVSLDVGYNRRYFHWREAGGQGSVTDNLLVGPSDYTAWTINAPVDSRLPDGGGYPITSYVLTAAASGRGATNYITLATDYGPERTDYWHGVDVTVNARLRNQLNLQVGTSTGRAVTDNCATTVLIDSPDPRNCRSVEPFLTTLRGSVAYTIPKVDVLIAATMSSQSGIALSTAGIVNGTTLNGAAWNVPNTVVQQLLGRLPPGALATGTTVVPLLDTDHRLYGPRRNAIDMRFAKIVKFRTTRTNVGVDIGNLLNSNQATAYQAQYDYVQSNGGSWLDPTTIRQPRFARFSLTFSF